MNEVEFHSLISINLNFIERKYPLLVSASNDKTIKFWNKSHLILTLNENQTINSLAYNEINLLLATGSSEGKIVIRKVTRYLQNINGQSAIKALIILPNGNIVSGSSDKTIKIGNSSSFKLIATLIGHSAAVFALTILHNGNIVSGSEDNTIKIWESITFDCIATLTELK